MGFPGIQGLTVAQHSKWSTRKLGFHTFQVLKKLPLPKDALATQTPPLENPPQKLLPKRKINRVLHQKERCYNQVQEVINMEKMADLGINVK